jgi:hypothetical protein
MNNSIQELWVEEKKSRKRMYIWLGLLFCGFSFLSIFISCWLTQPLFSIKKSPKLSIAVSSDRLKFHVETLSQQFYPRNESQIENLNKTANYIKEEFERAGGKISEQVFQVKAKTYRNIIASFGANSKERLIVGAHYDSAFQTPGADDNASGVAGLIELAYLFGKTSSTKQIDLVAYTLEEPPYFATEEMGSFAHAKFLKENGVDVRLMVSIEMIGYFSDEPNSQKFPFPLMSVLYPTKGNFIAVVGNFTNTSTVRSFKYSMTAATDLPVYSINAPTFISGIDFSDHKNYWKYDYDALMVTDTAFFRNFNYHQVSDTAEKLDYLRMAEVVKAIYNAVSDLSK